VVENVVKPRKLKFPKYLGPNVQRGYCDGNLVVKHNSDQTIPQLNIPIFTQYTDAYKLANNEQVALLAKVEQHIEVEDILHDPKVNSNAREHDFSNEELLIVVQEVNQKVNDVWLKLRIYKWFMN
jgi:hypothetical protein